MPPSRDLSACFNANGDTKRYSEAVAFYSCTWSNYYPADNYAFMNKCRSEFSSLIKLRLADILLLKAEALIQNGQLADGAAIIDRIRSRAGIAPLDAANVDTDGMVCAEPAVPAPIWHVVMKHLVARSSG